MSIAAGVWRGQYKAFSPLGKDRAMPRTGHKANSKSGVSDGKADEPESPEEKLWYTKVYMAQSRF